MTTNLARKLCKQSTQTETKLWHQLRNRRFFSLKFKRQYPIGPYIVDFICLEKKLIIELDGGQHSEQIDYDKERTQYLNKYGFEVLRFWNNEVFMQFDSVLEQIRLTAGV